LEQRAEIKLIMKFILKGSMGEGGMQKRGRGAEKKTFSRGRGGGGGGEESKNDTVGKTNVTKKAVQGVSTKKKNHCANCTMDSGETPKKVNKKR